jgi:hypothetical protein
MTTPAYVSMKEAVTRIISLFGDAMDFERKDGTGIWAPSVLAAHIHLQPIKSYYTRSFRGREKGTEFKCFATAAMDLRRGDRTAIDGVYYIVDSLRYRETHVEFGLSETDESQ